MRYTAPTQIYQFVGDAAGNTDCLQIYVCTEMVKDQKKASFFKKFPARLNIREDLLRL